MPIGMLVTRPGKTEAREARGGGLTPGGRGGLGGLLTVGKHLDPFLLLVVVARRRALVARELWTVGVGGGLSRRV